MVFWLADRGEKVLKGELSELPMRESVCATVLACRRLMITRLISSITCGQGGGERNTAGG